MATIRLKWNAPHDGGSAITGYTVDRSPAGAATWTTLASLASTATGYDDTTAVAGTKYDYRVTATNAIGSSQSILSGLRTGPDAVTSPLPKFGPTGLYWPPNTPKYDGSDSLHTIEATACTGDAIKTAINSLTATQVGEGVRILVPPGTLGAGDSATFPTINVAGDATWTKRVLVRPRDARSSVVFHYDSVFKHINNVIWAGFHADNITIQGGQNTGFTRILMSDWATWRVDTKDMAGVAMQGLYIGETVRRGVRVSNGDASNVNALDSDILAPTFEGLYISPNYKTDTGHTDTLQVEPFNGFFMRDAVMRGCVLYGASNTALQCNGMLGVTMDTCYLCENTRNSRYVYSSEYNPDSKTDGHGINGKVGAGRNHGFKFINCALLGNLAGAADATYPVVSVETSVTPFSGNNLYLATGGGSFTVDTTLHDDTYPDAPPVPDDAYLNSIWGL